MNVGSFVREPVFSPQKRSFLNVLAATENIDFSHATVYSLPRTDITTMFYVKHSKGDGRGKEALVNFAQINFTVE